MISVEYLMPFNTKDGQCKEVDSFTSLLSSNSFIKINDSTIIYKKAKYSIEIELTEMEQGEYSVFHITFSTSRLTPKFREMLKTVKKVVGPFLKDNIQLVWDGISFKWSKELYSQIYHVENSMRKLISKFMLINSGIDWFNRTVPSDVKNSIKKKNYQASLGILYEVDFEQLSNFLFKEYSFKETSKLPQVIEKLMADNKIDDEDKKEISEYLPKSNWDRYFSSLLDVESEQLEKKWKKLYSIRCKVAHNKPLDLEDFDTGEELCTELSEIIEKAITESEEIEIPEEDKEMIKLKTIASINPQTSVFVNTYSELSNKVHNAINIVSPVDYSLFVNPISNLVANNLTNPISVSSNIMDSLTSVNESWNSILNGSTILSPTNISKYTDLMENTNSLINLNSNNPFQINQNIAEEYKSVSFKIKE